MSDLAHFATGPRHQVADWAALSLDIESHPADEQRIFKLGAVRADSGAQL